MRQNSAEEQGTVKQERETSARTERRYYHPLVLPILLGFCTLFYYFGELIELLGWQALRWQFFYGVHDIQRLLFLGPIIYIAYMAGVKAAIITTLVTLVLILPRAFILSPFPDPILRAALFGVIAAAIGSSVGVISSGQRRS